MISPGSAQPYQNELFNNSVSLSRKSLLFASNILDLICTTTMFSSSHSIKPTVDEYLQTISLYGMPLFSMIRSSCNLSFMHQYIDGLMQYSGISKGQ